MMRLPVIALATVGGMLLNTPLVDAEPRPESNFQARPTALYAQLGLGTPLGWGGVEIEQTVTSFLAVSGGAGMGFAGPQLALMPRFRIAEKHAAATLGLGASFGKFHWSDNCLLHCSPEVQDGTVAWGNLEGGVELRYLSGFSVRGFVGYGHVIAGHLDCTSPGDFGCSGDHGRSLAYLGGAVGWAF